MKMTKGKVLFEEGERINGIYLIDKGRVIYTKKVDYTIPITNQTKNQWFVE
jgi:hypothetical protein